ncbi:TetR/AcrR family transcriptional regulator [Nocardioides zeae]|uniref:TetR/AcrR family transcriptional regulator n=1 Tax=Nocardioides zeae TaxID=1457234 RepID=UPI0030840E83
MTDSDPAPDAAPRARRGRPGYDQATLLRRAIDVFNRKGYDATSMGDLAAELGLTKSAIYHHVPSREHLLKAALDESLEELTAAVERARDPRTDGTAAERLRALVEESVHVLVAHQPAVTLLLRVRGNSELEQDALRRRRWIDREVAALVQEAVDEGALRDDLDPELVSRLLFGMVNSLVEWFRPPGDAAATTTADQVAAAVVAIAFDGLGRAT